MPAPLTPDRRESDRIRVLDAAERLVVERGIRAVGMAEVRTDAGVSLKRLYAEFPTKDALVVAVLHRRDERWRASLASRVTPESTPAARIDAMFEWLAEWFAQPDFRGCVWINAHGELDSVSPEIHASVRDHKRAFHAMIAEWLAPDAADAAAPIALLAEGAMVMTGIDGDRAQVAHARRAARRLLADASSGSA